MIEYKVAPKSREQTPEEKLVISARTLINDRMRQAHARLEGTGEQINARNVARDAFLAQKARMATTDTDEWTTSQFTTEQVATTILEAPFAWEAQRAIDELTPNQNRQRTEYVAILAQYNHDVASCLSVMSPRVIEQFPDVLFAESDKFTEGLSMQPISEDSFKIMIAGVRREVAVSRALRQVHDWKVRQATVEEDAAGVDLLIEDETGYTYSIDIKSANGFLRTVVDFESKGKLNGYQKEFAFKNGYIERPEGRAIIDADRFGELSKKFEYSNPSLIQDFIRERLNAREQRQTRKIGRRGLDIVNNTK